MKNVLFITNIPSPYRVDFFEEFSKKVNLTVWFENDKVDYREWESNYTDKGFDYKNFNFSNRSKLSITKELFNLLKNNQFDTYIVGGYSTPIGMISIICLKILKKEFILNADGGFIKNDNKINFMIKRFFISAANYWLSSGENCTNYLLHYGAKKENIYKYPFASVKYKENELIELDNESKQLIKSKYKLNNIVILTIGSFIKRKGIDVLLEAINLLNKRQENLDISVVIVGGGELKESYYRYIEANGITNVVLLDFLQKEELNKLYKVADIFVLPTREDIWGLVINEAMEFGLPIICSNKAASAYDLIEGNGKIFESENVEELASNLEELILNEDKRIEYGNCSKMKIKNYSSEKMADKHFEILKIIDNEKI